MLTNKDSTSDCKTQIFATTKEANDYYKTLESNILQYNRRTNKQTLLYWEEKDKMFKKLQRFSTLKKQLTNNHTLKPKLEQKLLYYSKKIQLCNEYETLHLTDIYSVKSFNEWLIKKHKNDSKEYSMIDVSTLKTSSKNAYIKSDKI